MTVQAQIIIGAHVLHCSDKGRIYDIVKASFETLKDKMVKTEDLFGPVLKRANDVLIGK